MKQARSKNLPPYRGETGACSSHDDCVVICFRFAFPRNRERVEEAEGWLLRDWPGASLSLPFRPIHRQQSRYLGRIRANGIDAQTREREEFWRQDEDGDETTLLTRVIL